MGCRVGLERENMRINECTKARFLQDIKDHEMTIFKEDGVYRHIRYGRPNSSTLHFDIMTFPGHLVLCGDMGTWTFARLHDMFEFFRSTKPGELQINKSYWHEKLQAADRGSGESDGMEYSEQRLIDSVKQDFDYHVEEELVKPLEAQELWEEIEQDIFTAEYEQEAYAKLMDFDYNGLTFENFEGSLKDYTFRYVWICYALSWAVGIYDKQKESK